MNSIEDTIKESNKKFDSLIIILKNRAESVLENALADPNELIYIQHSLKRNGGKFERSTPEGYLLMHQIVFQYLSASCTVNKDLIESIKKKFKLNPTEFWFIDLDKIINELNSINSSKKFRIDSYLTLIAIYEYLYIKIWSCIMRKFNVQINKKPALTQVIKHVKGAKREEKKLGHDEVKFDEENNIAEIKEILEMVFPELIEKKEALDFLNTIYKGKVESLFLPKIYKEYIYPLEDSGEGEKQLLVFKLFSLFMNDRFFYNEQDFASTITTYRNYNAYKKKTVKDILDLK